MGKLVKAYWDCQYCSEKGIDGMLRECPGCGKARDESVKFYMKGQAEYLTEEEKQKKSGRPDWFCEYCHSYNPDSEPACTSCGAPREGNNKNYHEMQQMQAQKAAQKAAQQAEAQKAYNGGGKKKASPLRFILIAAALLILGLIIFNLIPRKKDVTVKATEWSRAITVEQNQYLEQSDWNLPPGADLITTKDEIHHYETVLVGYESVAVERSRQVQNGYDYEYVDNGDGTYTENEIPHYDTEYYTEYEDQPVYIEEPVYETKYYYNAWVWVEERTETSQGSDHNVYWPELNLADDEREGVKTENYSITVETAKGKSSKYSLNESTWSNIQVGDGLTIKTQGGRDYIVAPDGSQIAELYD